MPYRLEGKRPVRYSLSPEDVLREIEVRKVKFVNLQFSDIMGRIKQVSIPSYMFGLESMKEGFSKLDGSSIRGFSTIEDSDMVLLPDPSTFAVLPWSPNFARMISDAYFGMGRGRLPTDPRWIAQRAEKYLADSFGLTSMWGPEVEFFVFDHVDWDTSLSSATQSYSIESKEAPWSDYSHRMGLKDAYYSTPPSDTLEEYRTTVSTYLEAFGILVEAHHHEVATAGQIEINVYRDTLTAMGDTVMTLKYVAKIVAQERGLSATFMPKPLFGDNASGMHVHISLWEGEKNIFYDEGDEYAELSQVGRYFVGGLLEHSRSLAAIVAPTTNSYKRLVPGYEAPVYIAWSRANRSANVRIPVYLKKKPDTKRVEFRTPDPSCNPYLAFAAILMAGLDGMKKKLDPGPPVDEDVYKLTPEKRRELGIKELPGSLAEAIESLKSDVEYLKPAFTDEILSRLIERAEQEEKALRIRPHPYEFEMYYNL